MGAMRIEWADEAKARLREIFDYHLFAAGLEVAYKITDGIGSRIYRLLPHNPQAGPREWLLEGEPHEYRRLVEGNYKIIYRIDGETVKIADIWDCRRDPEILRERLAVSTREN